MTPTDPRGPAPDSGPQVSREMTLAEWVNALPPHHRARKEYAALVALAKENAELRRERERTEVALGFQVAPGELPACIHQSPEARTLAALEEWLSGLPERGVQAQRVDDGRLFVSLDAPGYGRDGYEQVGQGNGDTLASAIQSALAAAEKARGA